MNVTQLESRRRELQTDLDGRKTQTERNVLGQFPTPAALADDILARARSILPGGAKVRFLDPAFGTGSFYSALKRKFPAARIEAAAGFEIDKHYGGPALKLWAGTGLDCRLADFTEQKAPPDDRKYNLIICNPPYVRHHHINGSKRRLQAKALASAGMRLSGLAGLYCYFMALAHRWMKDGGIAGWLVPSEFMDVNYGGSVRNYLLNEVTLLEIHRFDPRDVQFDDALVSSAVVWFRNRKPPRHHKARFSYGGTIDSPAREKAVSLSTLAAEEKWSRFPLSGRRRRSGAPRLGDFFAVKRGIVTGDNGFFILDRERIEARGLTLDQFRPILPSPRRLNAMEVKADRNGYPAMENQLFVLDCNLPLERIRHAHPKLHEYLEYGIRAGVSERYVCKHRKIWYSQEQRPHSRFYCTYIGRPGRDGKSPFRFILNRSKAIVANTYLILYPMPRLERALGRSSDLDGRLHEALNRITGQAMLDESRVYGGGMRKIEPGELSKVPAAEIQALLDGRSGHAPEQGPV